MKTRKKIASVARNLKVAADAKAVKIVSADAGQKVAANAAMPAVTVAVVDAVMIADVDAAEDVPLSNQTLP